MTGSYRWVHGVGSGGTPYRYVEPSPTPPHLAPAFTKLIVFLFWDEESARAGAPSGTGFIIGYPMKSTALAHTYLITNSHIARSDRDCVARVNLISGGYELLAIPRDAWFHHPAGDDVAAAVIDLDIQTHDVAFVTTNWLLKRDEDDVVGIGDECFFVGRHVSLDGRSKNTPAVRFGAISMMDPEPIFQPNRGHHQESIVVEARSLGGFSGAPVFAYPISTTGEPSFRGLLKDQQEEAYLKRWPVVIKPSFETPLCLLGIWGHMGAHGAEEVAPMGGLSEQEKRLAVNSGMMLVVPAWKIQELLDIEALVELREEEEREFTEKSAQSGAVMDSADGLIMREGATVTMSRDQERAMLVPKVFRALRGRDYRTAFGARQKIIVALPDDPMGYVFDHLAESCGVVAMPGAECLDLAVFAPASAARIAVAVEDDNIAQIHRDTTVSMLFAYLRHVDRMVVIEQVSACLIAGDLPVPC